MEHQIKRAFKNLIESRHGKPKFTDIFHLFQNFLRQLLACFVMLGHFGNDFFVPHPVLQHLGWKLNEIHLSIGATEPLDGVLSGHIVHDVP